MKTTPKRIRLIAIMSFILLFLLFSSTEQSWNKYILLGCMLLVLGFSCYLLKMFLGKVLKPLFDKYYELIAIIMFFCLLLLTLYQLSLDSDNPWIYALNIAAALISAFLCLWVLYELVSGFRIVSKGASRNADFKKEIADSKYLGDFLAPGMCKKIHQDKRSKEYFDDAGRILPDKELPKIKYKHIEMESTKAIIAASFIDALKRYDCLKEEYTTIQLIKISKKHLGVSSSISRAENRYPELFSWIAELHKHIG